VAVCAALEDYLPSVELGLKWPNDVHAAGRKIAGILVEIPNSPQLISRRVVIGIGLNVNNTWHGAPEELRGIGTSICDQLGGQVDSQRVLLSLLEQLEVALRQLVTGDSRLAQCWQSLCVLGGKKVEIDLGREIVNGMCRGIDTEGALVIENATGAQRLFGGVIRSISEA
jgi:BirA family biotin operon repressor/biotin-[acetyl-CoA-carboxylase] ligase